MKSEYKYDKHIGHKVMLYHPNNILAGWAIIDYGIIDEMIDEPYDAIFGWRIREYHQVQLADGTHGYAMSSFDMEDSK